MARRQRLLMVLPHLEVGGAQRVAVNLANFWAQSGHDVKILTTLEHKRDFYDLDPRIERLILQKPTSFRTTGIALRGMRRLLSLETSLRQRLQSFQPGPQGLERTVESAHPARARNFLTAAKDFIRVLPRPLVYLPARKASRIWRSIGAYSAALKSPDPRAHVTLFALLVLRTGGAAGRRTAHAYTKAKLKVGVMGKRSVMYCMQRPLLYPRPALMAQLLRICFWRVGALREQLRDLEPDAVVSFLSITNIITAAARYGLPYRLVISERNDPARQVLEEPWQSLRPTIYPLADLITANSHGALEQLQRYCPAEKLSYVANPLAISNEESQGKRTKRILFLARLVHQKAPDILVEAFAEFSLEHPEWSLEIAGDGPMEPELREQVCALGLENKVTFHGMVKDPTDLLTRSRIFALPSRFEGTPNSLLEAMASGLACIVSDASPGPLRLIEHEKSGLVVKTGDSGALAGALRWLAKYPDIQAAMTIAARERTREFLIDHVAREWEKLLFPDLEIESGRPERP